MIISRKLYSKNPWLAMIPKNESPDGFAGKYIPRQVLNIIEEMGMLNWVKSVKAEMLIPR